MTTTCTPTRPTVGGVVQHTVVDSPTPLDSGVGAPRLRLPWSWVAAAVAIPVVVAAGAVALARQVAPVVDVPAPRSTVYGQATVYPEPEGRIAGFVPTPSPRPSGGDR